MRTGVIHRSIYYIVLRGRIQAVFFGGAGIFLFSYVPQQENITITIVLVTTLSLCSLGEMNKNVPFLY